MVSRLGSARRLSYGVLMFDGRIDATTPGRAWRELVYVALCLPIGLFWGFWLLFAIGLGLALSFVLVGIPMLVVVMLIWRRVATWERERAALVLGAPIAQPYADLPREGAWRRLWARLRDRATWKDLGWFGVLATAGAVAGLVLIALWSAALVLITLPITASTFPEGTTIGDASRSPVSSTAARAPTTRPTARCGGSSATSMTGRSTGSSRSRSTSAGRARRWPTTRPPPSR